MLQRKPGLINLKTTNLTGFWRAEEESHGAEQVSEVMADDA